MKKYDDYYKEAKAYFKDNIFNDYLRCFAYGIDASCYLYVPKIVIFAYSENDIQVALKLANKYDVSICFRAAGTSLSGQAVSDSILVVIKYAFKNISSNIDSSIVKLGCGVVGASANNYLANQYKKIGPDPATINTALIGGIINNNSSGMCCGVKDNSYNTLKSLRIILSDGTLLDTSDAKSITNFKRSHSKLLSELHSIKEEILNDKELFNLIKKKYKIKNTTGYSLNAFIDFDDEIDILAHLIVGSEGTLAFLSEVCLNTVKDSVNKACALLFFENTYDAANTIIRLSKFDFISSAEIMDYASLKAASSYEELKYLLKDIKEPNTCVLLQTESDEITELENNIKKIQNSSDLAFKSYFSQDKNEYDLWWKIRKALLPIAASTRRPNSTVITEDVCFELKDLANGIDEISKLFEEFGFKDNGIIFGHALAGNIHFIITPNLNDKKEFENFSKFVEKMAQVVSSYSGSIKAEHGTGRMVAPFIEIEWGKQAYEINRKIKNIFDPKSILNKDVLICDDPNIYKKNIKEPSDIDKDLNTCMECGFCESYCPSNGYTLTPRQRIAILKEIERLKKLNDDYSLKCLKNIEENYEFFVNKSCAACGVCSLVCPLGINFANYSIDYRQKNISTMKYIALRTAYNNHSYVVNFAKKGLDIFNKSAFLQKNIDKIKLVKTRAFIPQANKFINKNTLKDENIIYFTSCLNKVFRPNKNMHDTRSLQEVVHSLCSKANIGIIYPPNDLCCSKAYEESSAIQDNNKEKLKQFLNENKSLKIVLDHGACSAKMINDFKEFEIYDLSEFILKFIIPKVKINQVDENIGLYTMCSSKKIGLEPVLLQLAKLCTSKKVIIDKNTMCCGFAGYKGFTQYKLNKNATINFSNFYLSKSVKRGFSNSSTCEIGLSEATMMSWQHIAYLVDECSL